MDGNDTYISTYQHKETDIQISRLFVSLPARQSPYDYTYAVGKDATQLLNTGTFSSSQLWRDLQKTLDSVSYDFPPSKGTYAYNPPI